MAKTSNDNYCGNTHHQPRKVAQLWVRMIMSLNAAGIGARESFSWFLRPVTRCITAEWWYQPANV